MQQSNCTAVVPEQNVTSNRLQSVKISLVEEITKRHFSFVRSVLKEMVASDMEDPRPYNLLGIIYEKEGNRRNASKCYRVAYNLDPTYTAARNNLDRVCESNYHGTDTIEWGIEDSEVNK